MKKLSDLGMTQEEINQDAIKYMSFLINGISSGVIDVKELEIDRDIRDGYESLEPTNWFEFYVRYRKEQ